MSQEPAVPRVLVSYVNPLDANAQLAMSIAEQLCRHGIPVELRPVSRAQPASVYRAVVLGGAVDDQHWADAALAYLGQCRGRPGRLWLFHTWFHPEPAVPGPPPPEVLRAVDHLRAGPVPTFGPASRTTGGHGNGFDDGHEAARRWASSIARRLDEEDRVDRLLPSGGRVTYVAAC
jgi:hypothetical protein